MTGESVLTDDERVVYFLTALLGEAASAIAWRVGLDSTLTVRPWDVMQVYLAATGRMRFLDQESSSPRVPAGLTDSGADRHDVWRESMIAYLTLDPSRAAVITGVVRQDALDAIDRFFTEKHHLDW